MCQQLQGWWKCQMKNQDDRVSTSDSRQCCQPTGSKVFHWLQLKLVYYCTNCLDLEFKINLIKKCRSILFVAHVACNRMKALAKWQHKWMQVVASWNSKKKIALGGQMDSQVQASCQRAISMLITAWLQLSTWSIQKNLHWPVLGGQMVNNLRVQIWQSEHKSMQVKSWPNRDESTRHKLKTCIHLRCRLAMQGLKTMHNHLNVQNIICLLKN